MEHANSIIYYVEKACAHPLHLVAGAAAPGSCHIVDGLVDECSMHLILGHACVGATRGRATVSRAFRGATARTADDR